MVAGWFSFKPKFPIWVNFGGPSIKKVNVFYGQWEHFTDIWEIL
jgi:hypothetical protein